MKDLTFFKVVRLKDGNFFRPGQNVDVNSKKLTPFTEHTVGDDDPGFHVFQCLQDAKDFVENVREICDEMCINGVVNDLVVCKCFVHGTLRKLRGNLVTKVLFLGGVVWLADVNTVFNNDDEKTEDNKNELER